MTKQTDELAALKARVEELERANKPPEPFVPKPHKPYDPTAGMCMPPSALRAMVEAVPDNFMRDVVRDNRAPAGPTGAIPSSQQGSNVRSGGGAPGGGRGWLRDRLQD